MKLHIQNDSIVSVSELNAILKLYQTNKNHPKIEIFFNNQITKFDIVFIAGLILLWHNYKTIFTVDYNNSLPNERIFEVRQYLQQYQKIYSTNWKSIFEKFKGIDVLTDEDYFASVSYSPIIFVNKDSIDNFFSNPKSAHQGSEVFNLRDKYIKEKITRHNIKEENYLNSSTSIKNVLVEYPTIYAFVFTVLYNKISPFVKSAKKRIANPVQRTEQLWEFTKEYVKGLYELAKNIVEHSSTGEGIITIRAYEDSESVSKVLEAYVFDFGTKGIIPKLIDDTKRNASKNKIYEEDMITLDKDFKLMDFIEPKVKTKLNQQLYRDIAHYGLIKFYKLVTRNKGEVFSSSLGIHGKRDYFPSNETNSEKTFAIGTSFYFNLPFDQDLFKPVEINSQTIELQGSPQTVSSISELIKLKVIKENEQSENRAKYLRIFEPTLKIVNRDDEETLFRRFVQIKNETNINYIAINCMKLKLSDSSLLRFLAHLSNNYSQGIIFYNLDFEVYNYMLENNELFFKTVKDLNERVPFWYENKGILIFTLLKGENFNFADMLFGSTKLEFQSVNRIINYTFPNALSNTSQIVVSNEDDFTIPECLKYYFHQSNLLPFDLLLFNENDNLLVQTNIETLLLQEMDGFDKLNYDE